MLVIFRLAQPIAYDIRKFEIELYWKRCTYFWTFIAVITGLIGWIFKERNDLDLLAPVALMILGILLLSICYIWYLVTKGSKYWQENWEEHVLALENEIVGPVYGAVLIVRKKLWPENLLQGLPFSVTKLNMIISLFVLLAVLALNFFIGLFFYNSILSNNVCINFVYFMILFYLFQFVICYFINRCGRFTYYNEVTQPYSSKFKFVIF